MKVVFFFLAMLSTTMASSQQMRLVLQHVHIVDMNSGNVQKDMIVVLSGGRITEITRSLKHPAAADTIIDAHYKFLIPGLWDMHVHIRNEENVFFPLLIANGVTGIRDMHNPFRYTEIGKWRDSINNSSSIAPFIGAAAGRIVDGYGDKRDLGFEIVNDSGDARNAVDRMHSYGADFIKVYNDLTLAEYLAIADEARKLHMPVAGHMPFGVSLDTIIQAGQQSIEHMSDLPFYFSNHEASIRKRLLDSSQNISNAGYAEVNKLALYTYDPGIARRKAALLGRHHVFVCPTLWNDASISYRDFPHSVEGACLRNVPTAILAKWSPPGLPDYTKEDSILYLAYHKRAMQLLGLLNRMKVPIIAGTDSSPMWDYMIPGYSLQFELQLYVKAGMTPYEALKTATINAAAYLHLQKDFGTVEKGKIADLILLDANPLINISNTQKINAVIINGQFLNRSKLDALLQQAEMQVQLQSGQTR